jgi:NADPH-dependent curcumin reductase CurA
MTTRTYRRWRIERFAADFYAAAALVEAPVPTPGPGEILVRNRYAGVNGIFDHGLSRNEVGYRTNLTAPIDCGVESIGVVEATGEGVHAFVPGDAAVFMAFREGGYREYSCAPAANAIKVPEASPEILALMPTGVSALLALEKAGEMKSGETIAITAAAGGLGHILVQLARHAGNHVVGICGGPEKAALVRGLGVDRVIDYKSEDAAAVLAQEFKDRIDIAYDTVGGALFDALLDNLSTFGRLIVSGFAADMYVEPEIVSGPRVYHKLYWKNASIRSYQNALYKPFHRDAALRLLAMYQNGDVKIHIDPVVLEGIERVPEAIEIFRRGKTLGKQVIRLGV